MHVYTGCETKKNESAYKYLFNRDFKGYFGIKDSDSNTGYSLLVLKEEEKEANKKMQ